MSKKKIVNPFTEQELNYIVLHKDLPNEELGYYLKRNAKEIPIARKTLGISEPPKRDWTSKETQYLIDSFGKISYDDMVFVLHRGKNSIIKKATHLGLNKNLKQRPQRGVLWTNEELEYLKKHKNSELSELSKSMNRSVSSVRNKLTELGYRKPTRKSWTKREDNFLYRNADTMTYAEIAKSLGKTITSVRSHAQHLGVSKYGINLNCNVIGTAFGTDKVYIRRVWIEKYGLPAEKSYLGKVPQYDIDPEEFWEWCEQHLDIVPMHKYTEGSILPEPNNLNELIMNAKKYPKNYRKPYGVAEIRKIKAEYAKGISVEKLANKYGRSKCSIRHALHAEI